MKEITIIESCNFDNFPSGGQLTFVKNMIKAFGSNLRLVGISTDNTPIGKWVIKEIDGIKYNYFSIMFLSDKSNKKPWIPLRIRYYLSFLLRRNKVFQKDIGNIFIQAPEVLLALNNREKYNICYRSPGVTNMLESSRFWYAHYFSVFYNFFFYNALSEVKVILASADKQSIHNFIKKSNNKLNKINVVQYPTRIDRAIFKPMDIFQARSKLDIPSDYLIVTTSGRLGKFKGWKFMIDCFKVFIETNPKSMFYFIGDGEDREKIINYIEVLGLKKQILLLGKLSPIDLANYLNASNLYIMGSMIEGWCTTLVEAIACAKPVCVTEFSSATDLIENGVNGYVIKGQCKEEFVKRMNDCLTLLPGNLIEVADKMDQYSLSTLKKDLLLSWKLL